MTQLALIDLSARSPLKTALECGILCWSWVATRRKGAKGRPFQNRFLAVHRKWRSAPPAKLSAKGTEAMHLLSAAAGKADPQSVETRLSPKAKGIWRTAARHRESRQIAVKP